MLKRLFSKIKVKPYDRILLNKFNGILSFISTVASIILIFIDIPSKWKVGLGSSLLILLVIIYSSMLYKANTLQSVNFKIGSTTIEIKSGNIFDMEGYKIIAFNQFYDTEVNDVLVAKRSINAQYINHFYPNDISKLNNIIENDLNVEKNYIGISNKPLGKNKKYKLGTLLKNDDYLLLAFSRFDDDNRAFLTTENYISCLMKMWDECDIHFAGQSINVPLLGAGLTRLRGYEEISDQERLEILLWTFKTSKLKLREPSKLVIVLSENTINKINLYDISNNFGD